MGAAAQGLVGNLGFSPLKPVSFSPMPTFQGPSPTAYAPAQMPLSQMPAAAPTAGMPSGMFSPRLPPSFQFTPQNPQMAAEQSVLLDRLQKAFQSAQAQQQGGGSPMDMSTGMTMYPPPSYSSMAQQDPSMAQQVMERLRQQHMAQRQSQGGNASQAGALKKKPPGKRRPSSTQKGMKWKLSTAP